MPGQGKLAYIDDGRGRVYRPARGGYAAGTLMGKGVPKSGTSGTGANRAGPGDIYVDRVTGAQFINSGRFGSPYWTPVGPLDGQNGLWGVASDWRENPATALTDTAVAIIHASGVRIFGQGIAETDSGALANASGEGPLTLRATTTDEDGHTVAVGTKAGVYQPDQHGVAVVECKFTDVSAITLRAHGLGFVGIAADAFDPPVTGATTTMTLVQDDLALMHQDVGYTDGDRIYLGSNKSDAAASATPTDSGQDLAAAGTMQLWRAECDPNGTVRFFVNRELVGTIAAALDADEEASPVWFIESTSAAVKSADLEFFRFWAGRLSY